MTYEEWKKHAAILKTKITKARNKAKHAVQLAIKLELLQDATRNEKLLHDHKLHYYELVKE